MRNWVSRTALVVVFWGVVLAGGYYLSSLYPPQHPVPVCEGGKGGESAQKPCNRSLESLGTAVLDWLDADNVIAFFTVILGIGTVILVRDGREHSRRSLRAYISFEGINLHPFVVGQPIGYSLRLRNVGTSPAHKVSVWSGIGSVPFPYSGPWLTGPVAARGTTGPGQLVANSGNSGPDFLVSDAFLDAIKNGTACVIIYGECDYVDAFGEPQKTKFRLLHGGNILANREAGVLWKAEDGNDAT